MRIAIILVAAIFLAGCEDKPKYKDETLGTVAVSDHKTPIGGLGRRLCQFRVEVAGLALGYAGSSTTRGQHNKCLTMRNGDRITVTRRTRIAGKDDLPEVQYFGQVGEVVFRLN